MPLDSDDSFALVRDDVRVGIGDIFTTDGDFNEAFTVAKSFTEQEVITNGSTFAVPWTYDCRHTGDFQGLFPTNRKLTIEGVTLLDTSGNEPLLHRYVDWVGVIAQLGIDVSWRVPVTEAEYLAGRELLREPPFDEPLHDGPMS